MFLFKLSHISSDEFKYNSKKNHYNQDMDLSDTNTHTHKCLLIYRTYFAYSYVMRTSKKNKNTMQETHLVFNTMKIVKSATVNSVLLLPPFSEGMSLDLVFDLSPIVILVPPLPPMHLLQNNSSVL